MLDETMAQLRADIKDLTQLRVEIEDLKRRLLEAILAELEETIRLRETREQRHHLRINTMDEPGCGLLGPVRHTR